MLQIAAENGESLLQEKFNSESEKILNRTLMFDNSCIDEEKIIDKIIESLHAHNDELYIENEPGINVFALKNKDGN